MTELEVSKTYDQKKLEWFDANLKFVSSDFRQITCDRCNRKGVTYGAFGYGSSYSICSDCYMIIRSKSNV